MEERPNNSRSVPDPVSRRFLSSDDQSTSDIAGTSADTGFVRNVFSTGGAQASVDSTSSDSSDCSALAGTSAERPGSPPGSPAAALPPPAAAACCAQGPKFKLTHEGDVQLCRLNHSRTVISKILSSKFLRRWETHRVVLGTSEMSSKTVRRCLLLALFSCSLHDLACAERLNGLGYIYCVFFLVLFTRG